MALVELDSEAIELGDVVVGEEVLELELEVLVGEFGVDEGEKGEFFKIEVLVLLRDEGLLLLELSLLHVLLLLVGSLGPVVLPAVVLEDECVLEVFVFVDVGVVEEAGVQEEVALLVCLS